MNHIKTLRIASHVHFLHIFSFLLITLAIPATILLSQQNSHFVSHAQEQKKCTMESQVYESCQHNCQGTCDIASTCNEALKRYIACLVPPKN